MKVDLEKFYLESLPSEIRSIRVKIMDFTQIVPPYNIAAYSEYLVRCKRLLEIDQRLSSILYNYDEKDEFYYMEIDSLTEAVDKIIDLQRKSK